MKERLENNSDDILAAVSLASAVLLRRIERMEKSLQRMLEWIRTIDTKAQIILGINLAMLGSLVALAPDTNKIKFTDLVTLGTGGAFPSISCVMCIFAFFPHIKGPTGSLIFFGSIAKRDLEIFSQDLSNQTDKSYYNDLQSQVHRNAQIVAIKYRIVKYCIIFQLLGIMPWILACYTLHGGSLWENFGKR